MAGVDENKAFAQRFFDDLYNRRRLALAEELVTQDFVDHTAPDGAPAGPSGLRATLAHLHNRFHEYRYVIEDLIAEEDRVVALLTFIGTPVDRAGAASDRVVHPEIQVLRMVDGKGAERWTAIPDLAP